MKMRTIYRALAFALLVFSAGIPVGATDYVKVSSANGEATYFALSEKPVVTFAADKLVLTTAKQTVEYPLTEFRSFEFTNQTTAIASTKEKATGAVFSFGTSLKGEGLPAGSRVIVYAIGGQVVGSGIVSETGTVDIPLGGKTGAFIVKSSSKTFKFIMK